MDDVCGQVLPFTISAHHPHAAPPKVRSLSGRSGPSSSFERRGEHEVASWEIGWQVRNVRCGGRHVGCVRDSGFFAVASASPSHPAARHGLTYTPLTLQNGWGEYGSGTRKAAVAKDSDGIVHFKGAIATGGSNNIAFTLPKAFWPGGTVYVQRTSRN